MLWIALGAIGPALSAYELGEEIPEPQKGQTFPFEDGFVNLRIVENTFRVYFLDAEKKLIAPSWTNAQMNWEHRRNPTQRGLLSLSPGSGPFLSNPRLFHPPHFYTVRLLFLQADGQGIKKEFPRVPLSQ